MRRLFFLILLLATACGNKPDLREQAKTLYKESMDIHDVIMPRMDELFTLRHKLTLRLDSLNADPVAHAADIELIRKTLLKLEAADKAMMDWMHNIQEVPGDENEHAHHGSHQAQGVSLEDVINVQQQQKENIESIRKEMEESVAAGNALLK